MKSGKSFQCKIPIGGDALELGGQDTRIDPVELQLIDELDGVVVGAVKGAQLAHERVHFCRGRTVGTVRRPGAPQPAGQHVLAAEQPVVLEPDAAHENVKRINAIQLLAVTVAGVASTAARFRL